MEVYTWDFKSLLNFAPLSGEAKVSYSLKGKKGLPQWARGLAERRERPVPFQELQAIDPRMAASFGYSGVIETTDSLLPAAGEWANAVYAALDKRYPHNPESGPGFFYYDTSTDVRLIYDPGVDMHQEWQKIFGKTAAMFTNCRRAKPSFRPWTANDGYNPLVFYDGQREDWALTDTLGAPYFARASVQTSIDFMYVLGMEDSEVLLPAVRKELGEAIRAWRCPVHPKDVLGR